MTSMNEQVLIFLLEAATVKTRQNSVIHGSSRKSDNFAVYSSSCQSPYHHFNHFILQFIPHHHLSKVTRPSDCTLIITYFFIFYANPHIVQDYDNDSLLSDLYKKKFRLLIIIQVAETSYTTTQTEDALGYPTQKRHL